MERGRREERTLVRELILPAKGSKPILFDIIYIYPSYKVAQVIADNKSKIILDRVDRVDRIR